MPHRINADGVAHPSKRRAAPAPSSSSNNNNNNNKERSADAGAPAKKKLKSKKKKKMQQQPPPQKQKKKKKMTKKADASSDDQASSPSSSPWQAKLSAAAHVRATATTEELLCDAEAQLTHIVTAIPDGKEEAETWSKAGGKLATLLLQSGRSLGLASSLLAEQGFRYRLSVAALTQDHSRPAPAPAGAAAAWDHALPPHLLAALSKVFFPAAPFWAAHNYSDGSQRPPTPYFSFVVPLAPEEGAVPPASSSRGHKHTKKKDKSNTGGGGAAAAADSPGTSGALMDIIRHLQRVTAAAFPAVAKATAAEWWCHSRPHSSGHQLHFDSDDEGRGGVRNPIISTVTYLSPAGIGGETLVTAQAVSGTKLARVGHLCAGRRNRLLAFRGDLLHGVVPGAGCGPTHRKGRRVTFMVAFWRRLTVQDKPGPGSARPFARFAGEPWAAALVAPAKKKNNKPAPKKEEATAAKPTRPTKPAKGAFFQVPVWEDVDPAANDLDGAGLDEVVAAGRMPAYNEFFQFA